MTTGTDFLKHVSRCTDPVDGSWIAVWVFPRFSQDRFVDLCLKYDIVRYYGGVGREFSCRPYVRHGKTRSVIIQRGGMDI
jgi:hypothetical protein